MVCRNCLLAGIGGRIRAHLLQSAALGQCVAVALSGGAGSLLLLDIVSRSMDSGRKRRMFDRAVAVLVDTSRLVCKEGGDTYFDIQLGELLLHVLNSGVDVIIVPAELSFQDPVVDTDSHQQQCVYVAAPLITPPTDFLVTPTYQRHRQLYDETEGAAAAAAAVRDALHTLRASRAPGGTLHEAGRRLLGAFAACTSRDTKQDLLSSITEEGIRRAARQIDCPFILTGTTSDRAAAQVLARVCKGRGLSVPLDVAPAGGWVVMHAINGPHATLVRRL
jgi:hypothetical protein